MRNAVIAAAVAASLIGACAASDSEAAMRKPITIPAQNLGAALESLAKARGFQVIYLSDEVDPLQTAGVTGQFTADEALGRLLSGSGLSFRHLDDSTVTIFPTGTVLGSNALGGDPAGTQLAASGPTKQSEEGRRLQRLAQVSSGPDQLHTTDVGSHEEADDSSEDRSHQSGEVVVTGSRIRGVQPTSTVHTVTREDIDNSGYSQVGDVLRSLPEAFGGGNNPGVVAGAAIGNIANQNISNASTINLRGLGSDATLTLLNGHRLASDAFYQSADISGIPLAAIDRIEVLTDGASALYGSDAVAGVANIILRSNYNGIDASARVGTATQGGGLEQVYSVLGGTSWSSGHVMVNGEYGREEAIRAYQRDFSDTATANTMLLEPNVRHSLFIEIGQGLTDALSLSVDGLYHERDVRAYYNYTGDTEYFVTQDTHEYAVYPTLTYTFESGWRALLTGGYARARNHDFDTDGMGKAAYDGAYKNRLAYSEITADGPLITLPTGTVRLALGGGYRSETYSDGSTTSAGDHGDRNIRYAYAEALVPLAQPSKTRIGLQQLELSLAGRTEHYNVFGNTSNPKFGIRYVPWTGWTFRGSWGKSFKAPSLLQEYQEYEVYIEPVKYLGLPDQPVNGLLTWGGDRTLRPERSRSWTTSVEFAPPFSPGFTVSATYFNINYQDRVVQPVANSDAALSEPIYSSFVIPNPSAALQAQTLQGAHVYNYSDGPYDPSNVVAIVEDQYYNATAQRASGVDVSIRDAIGLGAAGHLNVFANGSWLRLTQRTVLGAPEIVLSGTVFNPARSRARGGATWLFQGLSVTGTLNYVASETDNVVTPAESVASWTTLDANVAYRFMEPGSYLKGLELSGSVINAFDRAPPYTHGGGIQYLGLYYDSTNASAVGRFVALTLRKRW